MGMCAKYKLDGDATDKLTDLLAKRPDTVANDIIEVEKSLYGSAKPSALVMKMIVAIDQGKEMPKVFNPQPPPQPEKTSEARSTRPRSRSRVTQRYSDQSKERWYDKDRDRDRNYDRGDRDRDR